MASPALLSWIQSTVLIENDWGEMGTGFLVMRAIRENQAKAFLVTNKHVLNRDPTLRQQAQQIHINVNMRQDDGSIEGRRGILPLTYTDGPPRWREHPDADVDVLAFDVTSLITEFPQVERKMADYSAFADANVLAEHEITIGDDILTIGYPVGLRQGSTNYPIVRSGIVASRIGETLRDEIDEGGVRRAREMRGFLIDAGTVPGQSGSPVILKPMVGRYVKGAILMNVAPAILLGMVSETRYAPIQTPSWSIPSFAGIGLALDAETIKETIELFFE
jgi:S1-C subfamily serine protease